MRADARGPAKRKRQAQNVSAKGRPTLVTRFHTRFTIKDRDAENIQEMQAKDNHHNTRNLRKQFLILQKERPEGGRRKAKDQENRTKAQHKEKRRKRRFATACRFALHIVEGHPAHISEIGRHNRQDTRAEKADNPGQKRHKHCRQ